MSGRHSSHDGSTAALFGEARQARAVTCGPGLKLYVRAAGDGPTVLVVGGTHGDEYEGQIAVADLARQLDELPLTGRLVCLPRHNPGACDAGERTDPADGVDLNRQYAEPDMATKTGRIAGFVNSEILPEIDVLIDLHSGGKKFEFVPSGNVQARIGSQEDARMRHWLHVFGAPYGIVFDDIGTDSMPHRGTMEAAARAQGAKAFSSELGGSGRVSPQTMRRARTGLINLLTHVGLLPDTLARPGPTPKVLRLDAPEHNVMAAHPGLLEPLVLLGTDLRKGDIIARLHHDGQAEDVAATCTGCLAAWQVPTRIDFTEPIAMICPLLD